MDKFRNKNLNIAKNLRKNQTPRERKLWYCFLKTYQIKFRKQFPIEKFIVDFYCTQAKLAIELDGSEHYSNISLEKDKDRDSCLNKIGVKVLRIVNIDIDKNFDSVCELIDYEVKNRICK